MSRSGSGRRQGLRHPYYGTLYNVGQNGFSWSSSTTGTNAYYLDFNNARVTPQNSNNRANGFQVRCLQAFIRDTLFSFPPHLSAAGPEASIPE